MKHIPLILMIVLLACQGNNKPEVKAAPIDTVVPYTFHSLDTIPMGHYTIDDVDTFHAFKSKLTFWKAHEKKNKQRIYTAGDMEIGGIPDRTMSFPLLKDLSFDTIPYTRGKGMGHFTAYSSYLLGITGKRSVKSLVDSLFKNKYQPYLLSDSTSVTDYYAYTSHGESYRDHFTGNWTITDTIETLDGMLYFIDSQATQSLKNSEIYDAANEVFNYMNWDGKITDFKKWLAAVKKYKELYNNRYTKTTIR